MMRYEHVGSPIEIGPVTVKNRILSSAHLTHLAHNGSWTEGHIAYYEAKARGGVGLVGGRPLRAAFDPEGWHSLSFAHGVPARPGGLGGRAQRIRGTLEDARRLGGEVLLEPTEDFREAKAALIADPTGAAFFVYELDEAYLQ